MPNPFDPAFATFYPPFVAAPLQMEGAPLEGWGWVPPERPTSKPLLSSWERDLYHYRQAQIYVEAHQEPQQEAWEQAMLRTIAQENAKAIAEAKK